MNNRTDTLWNVGPYVLALFSAAMMGVLAASGQPLYTLLFAGALTGLLLFTQPVTLLWLTLISTLVLAGTVQYFIPALGHVWWITYGLAAMLFVPAVTSRLTQAPFKTGVSATTISAWLLLAIALLSTLINRPPPWQIVLSVKSALLFGGVWAALALAPLDKDTVKRWLLGFVLIGLAQFAPVLYQYLFVRSSRLERGLGTVEASDSVVGTFGGSMEAGGLTAVLALYLVMMIIAMLSLYKNGVIEKSKLGWALFLLGIPLLFMEVKVIFIYLPLSLMILYKDTLYRRPGSFIVGSVVVVSILGAALLAYQVFHWSTTGRSLEDNIKHLSSYSFNERAGDEHREMGLMTRREVLEFWWAQNKNSRNGRLLIGHGLGAVRTQGLGVGNVAARYAPLRIDSSGAAVILWETGIIGLGAVLLLIVSGYRYAGRLARCADLVPWQKSLAQGVQAIMPLFVVSLFYRADIPYAPPAMFLFMTAFGLLAWLEKQARRRTALHRS